MNPFRPRPGRRIPRRDSSAVRGRASAPRVGAAIVLLLASLAPASAQTTVNGPAGTSRAERLEAQRRAKATAEPAEALGPPQRGFLESKLYWFDNQYVLTKLLSGWHGVHYAAGDFPAGAGLKFGVGFTDLAVGNIYADEDRPNRVDVDAVAAYTTRGYAQVFGRVAVRNLGGVPLHLGVHGGYSESPQEDFFGLGPNTGEGDRTNYLLESTEVGARLDVEPTGWLRAGVGLSRLAPRVGTGTDGRFPATQERFDPTALPGFLDRSDFRRTDASVAISWLDRELLPRSGGLYSLTIGDYHDLDDGRLDFRQYEVRLEQYVPLGGPARVLALRGAAVVSDTDDGQQVPFFYQPTLGGKRALRGFREFRFRDRNSLLLTAEYRWEAWWALDGALFVDAGKVAFDRHDLDFHDLEASYGIGFRVHSNSAYSFGLDLAFSREGFIPFFGGGYGF